MVRGISHCGANFQALVQQTICIYGTHAQSALDDPTRSSSAAGLGIWPIFHIFVVKNSTFGKHSLKLKYFYI